MGTRVSVPGLLLKVVMYLIAIVIALWGLYFEWHALYMQSKPYYGNEEILFTAVTGFVITSMGVAFGLYVVRKMKT